MARTGKAPRIVFARYLAAAAMAATLVACSSGSKGAGSTTTLPQTTETIIVPAPTTTTTLPPKPPTAAEIAKTRAFLLGAGAPLVTFETLTKPLVTPKLPTQFTCDNLERVVLPKIGRPSDFIALAAKVPDRALAYQFDRDIRTKNLLLQACSQFKPQLAPGPMAFTRNQTATLTKRLALFSIVP